jgi:hypothetical protein
MLCGPPRLVRQTISPAEGTPLFAYPVMVTGFGKPFQIAVRVPGPAAGLAEGDILEFTELEGRLYRGKSDTGPSSQRVMFAADAVGRASARRLREDAAV